MRHRLWATENRLKLTRLAACLGVGAAVWLGVLPRVARLPEVRSRIVRDETLGVDPSAKFYTELPAMSQVLERLDAVERRQPGVFW